MPHLDKPSIVPLEDCQIMSGGMGANVLSPEGLGRISGMGAAATASVTAAEVVVARELMRGNEAFFRALGQFPVQYMAEQFADSYWREGGVSMDDGRKLLYDTMPFVRLDRHNPRLDPIKNNKVIDAKVIGGFVLVRLAIDEANKHADEWRVDGKAQRGPVGINALYKIIDGVGTFYGAMLAGADYMAMGAGVPGQIPRLLSDLAHGRPVEYLAKVVGAKKVRGDRVVRDYAMPFDPTRYTDNRPRELDPMAFLLIATTADQVQAFMYGRSDDELPYGYVMENHYAGGHNAPPIGGKPLIGASAELEYSERDELDIDAMNALGVPYWVAGDQSSPDKVQAAIAHGARGIQVGSVMALADESNFLLSYRQPIVMSILSGNRRPVAADPYTSPSGYPFNVVDLPGTLSDPRVAATRQPVCDIRKLVEIADVNGNKYVDRCPADTAHAWERDGGTKLRRHGQNCLCNSLLAAIGLGQVRSKDGKIYREPAEITLGSGETVDIAVRALCAATKSRRRMPGYSVTDAIRYLRGEIPDLDR